jgi:hypothetical protein
VSTKKRKLLNNTDSEKGCTRVPRFCHIPSRHMSRHSPKHFICWSSVALQEPLDIGKGYARLCRVAGRNIRRRSDLAERSSRLRAEWYGLLKDSGHKTTGKYLRNTLLGFGLNLFTQTVAVALTGRIFFISATAELIMKHLPNLTDSPVGLLAWIGEKLYAWTDNYPWTPEELITWTMLYVVVCFQITFVMLTNHAGTGSTVCRLLEHMALFVDEHKQALLVG